MPPIQSPLVVAFSVKGEGLHAAGHHRVFVERFRVTVLCLVYLNVCGEVAETLKAAVC